jgi:hypothetical protein
MSLRSELADLRRAVAAQLPPIDGERVRIYVPWNFRDGPLPPQDENAPVVIYDPANPPWRDQQDHDARSE